MGSRHRQAHRGTAATPGRVRVVAFSPDGQTAVTASTDDTARLWEAATGKAIGPALRHRGKVETAAFSPDGKTVVTGSTDRTAQLWDAATGRSLGRTLKHQSGVFAVAFSPDGKLVATGSNDETAQFWDANTGEGWQGAPTSGAGPRRGFQPGREAPPDRQL